MARLKSEDKRCGILEAAIRLIVTQGLGASTAAIAREAGVANGSLFTYFPTKADLYNQLYLELKAEMASAALKKLPTDIDVRKQMLHVWTNWMDWAVAHPQKRRSLMQLSVAEEITPATRKAGHVTMTVIGELLDRSRGGGPLRNAPKGFVVALLNSMADATMDSMLQDPGNAKKLCKCGFEALWRVLA